MLKFSFVSLAISDYFVIISGYWSRSITVSTTGFHPVNRSSTLLEITKF